MDKKGFINKANEPSEQFQTYAIDVMMYVKYKLKNGLALEGLIDLLKRFKASLIRILSS
jgi:hypothetical protein